MSLQYTMRTGCWASVRHVKAVLVPPVRATVSMQKRSVARQICRAEEEGSSPTTTSEASPQQSLHQQQQEQQQKQENKPAAPLLAKGQGTAILTGAISIIFGIGYLVLVQLLDMRGGELLPPPPEAYGP